MLVRPNCAAQQPNQVAFCDECRTEMDRAAVDAAAVVCPTCGAPVTPGDAFCEYCGIALNLATPAPPQAVTSAPSALICSSCGIQLEPDSNFCDMCGAPVSEPLASAPVSAPSSTFSSETIIQGCLVVQETGATLLFPLGKAEIIVGREDPVSGVFPAIDLTEHGGGEGGVSRQHARILIQGGQVSIEDLHSTNHTYVNQQKLTPECPHQLNDGDEIRLGRVKLDFHTQNVKAKE